MPTYDYTCKKCGNVFESFERIDGPRTKECPRCGGRAVRNIGPGAGIIFKGSGFYQTDYRSEEYKKRSKEESTPSTKAEEKTAGEPKKRGGKGSLSEKKA